MSSDPACRPGRSLRLRSLLIGIGALISSLVLLLAAWVVRIEWTHLADSEAGLTRARRLQDVLRVAEMASRERGPANGVMGEDLPTPAGSLERLAQARERTDAAFDALHAQLPPGEDASRHLGDTRERLKAARAQVDRIAAKPAPQRRAGELRQAVSDMFEVIDDLAPVATRFTDEARQAAPELAGPLTAARRAADLRELAGRLGSLFTSALARRQVLGLDERLAIEHLRGRIEELRQQLQRSTSTLPATPQVAQAMALMQQRYFGDTQAFIAEQLRIGMSDGRFELDTSGFAARYVPDMDSFLLLRDALLEQALTQARAERDRAALRLSWAAAGAGLTLLLLVSVVVIVNRRVVQPLTDSTAIVSALAAGRLDQPVPQHGARDEVGDLLRALELLRQDSLERQALERERQNLIELLRDQSNTDFLTGLLNRRGFMALGGAQLPALHRRGAEIAVAVFDLDHFKLINDRHGHICGDAVLDAIGEACRQWCRRGDLVSRYGGEEFVILMPDCTVQGAWQQAERLRNGVASLRIEAPGHPAPIEVTISVGVATCRPGETDLARIISRADTALYAAKREGRNRVRVYQEPAPGERSPA
ncbi:diguanylate cyclase (GGDEF)-like protein [Sphaerotilus hippei]|uniref:diguanylate cyclase n=1 Tax=Sphaerotilus hippei TaxID=744406 RepID=A0A318GUW4_9BURK|nr:GGDEF domain-containing protein [Sphaerotilus hippei]PXW92268.1 diguanylate cyclase (GGDEF)-like protein [Sphaerotilus hippei]